MSADRVGYWRAVLHTDRDCPQHSDDAEFCPLLLPATTRRKRILSAFPHATAAEADQLERDLLDAYRRDAVRETAGWRKVAIAEALAVASGYGAEELAALANATRSAPPRSLGGHIWIVVAYCRRPRALARLLRSLRVELRRTGRSGSDITVLIFEDGGPQRDEVAATIDLYDHAGGLSMRYISMDEADRALHAAGIRWNAHTRLLFGGEGASSRGAQATANVAKVFLRRVLGVDRRDVIWHIDSDEEFGGAVLTPANRIGRRDGLFDYFGSLEAILDQHPESLVSLKVTGDPPMSPSVMSASLMGDLCAAMSMNWSDLSCRALDVRHYDNDLYPYYDIGTVRRLRTRELPAVYPPALGEEDDSPRALVAALSRHVFGVHATRPILYHPRGTLLDRETGVDRRVEGSDIINPGNVVYRSAGLQYPYPLAGLRLRMGGPLAGIMTEMLEPGVVKRAFLPLYHNRAPRTEVPEYRAGVTSAASGVDGTEEARRQILGDVLLHAVHLCKARGLGLADAPRVLDEAADRVGEEFIQNGRRVLHLAEEARAAAAACSWLDETMRADVVRFVSYMERTHRGINPRELLCGDEVKRLAAALAVAADSYRIWRAWMK